MKIAWIEYSFLCVLNLQCLAFYHTEAMSREISYPIGSSSGRRYFIQEIPNQNHFQSLQLKDLSTETTAKPQVKTKKKFKRKMKKLIVKHPVKAQDENDIKNVEQKINNTKKRGIRKKKNRKKFVKTYINEEKNSDLDSLETFAKKSRKPVDIVVHIKMED